MAGGGLLLLMVLFILDLHSDPAGLKIAQWVQMFGKLGIGIACISLGIKARRRTVPANEGFGYSRALGAGVVISLVASALGILTTLFYGFVLHPGFQDVVLQAQAEALEARGMSAARIEQVQRMSAMWMKPHVQAVGGFFGDLFTGTLISLVAAAILKQPSTDKLPSA